MSADKIMEDAIEQAMSRLKARADLDAVAESFGVDAAGKTDREVMEMVIQSFRPDADISGKSDDYVRAAFDMTVAMKGDSAIAIQRASCAPRVDASNNSQTNSYKTFMAELAKQENK